MTCKVVAALVLLAGGCGTTDVQAVQDAQPEHDSTASAPEAAIDASALSSVSPPWTFAVLSDLHLPNPNEPRVEHVVAALIKMHVRLVVITGDHTNGNHGDHRRTFAGEGWQSVTAALMPLREAGIPVLPVAGNHDASETWQQDEYAAAFADLQAWAAPLVISPGASGPRHARPPFSYSVDVDDVHFSLAHVVGEAVEPAVATWLTADLHGAADAKQRIVFSHVPMMSVMSTSIKAFTHQYGALLEDGHATMHVAGHEHLIWDEDVTLPSGTSVREVIVGCTSGLYQYGPTEAAMHRAGCTPIVDSTRREPMRCRMPHGGGRFEVTRGRKHRHIQHARTLFALFTVDGDSIDVRPMTLDPTGAAVPFYFER